MNEKIYADMEMINKAKQFLIDTNTFYNWCNFTSKQFIKNIGKSEWLHSDRWSLVYDWVHDGKFNGIEIPENIETCLVEYWETNFLTIKKEKEVEKMRTKDYYINTFNKKWDDCLEKAKKEIHENGYSDDILSDIATEIFEETANAKEIVGYYIMYHKDYALKDWRDNTVGIKMSNQDLEVDRILTELFNKGE